MSTGNIISLWSDFDNEFQTSRRDDLIVDENHDMPRLFDLLTLLEMR
jgi:hypothetical protein